MATPDLTIADPLLNLGEADGSVGDGDGGVVSTTPIDAGNGVNNDVLAVGAETEIEVAESDNGHDKESENHDHDDEVDAVTPNDSGSDSDEEEEDKDKFIDELETQVVALEEGNLKLKGRAESSERDADAKTKQIDELIAERDSFNDHISRLQSEIQAETDAKTRLENQLAALQTSFDELTAEHDQQLDADPLVVDHKSRADQYHAHLRSMSDYAARLRGRMIEMEEQFGEFTHAIKGMYMSFGSTMTITDIAPIESFPELKEVRDINLSRDSTSNGANNEAAMAAAIKASQARVQAQSQAQAQAQRATLARDQAAAQVQAQAQARARARARQAASDRRATQARQAASARLAASDAARRAKELSPAAKPYDSGSGVSVLDASDALASAPASTSSSDDNKHEPASDEKAGSKAENGHPCGVKFEQGQYETCVRSRPSKSVLDVIAKSNGVNTRTSHEFSQMGQAPTYRPKKPNTYCDTTGGICHFTKKQFADWMNLCSQIEDHPDQYTRSTNISRADADMDRLADADADPRKWHCSACLKTWDVSFQVVQPLGGAIKRKLRRWAISPEKVTTRGYGMLVQ